MAWVKIDDHFDDNPELEDLSCEAVTLFICATTWCARHESDGEIPEKTFRKLKGFSKKSCAELCAGDKPWIQIKDGGFIVRNFLKYNPSKEQIEAEREATRLRVTGFRSKKKQQCNGVTDTVTPTVSNAGCNTSPVPVPDISISSLRSDIESAREEKPVKTYDDEWSLFSSAYPKRNGSLDSKKGREKFDRLCKSGTDPNDIIDGARRYKIWADANGRTKTDYVKQIPTWLNGECWKESWDLNEQPKNGKQNIQGVYQEAMAALEEMSQ